MLSLSLCENILLETKQLQRDNVYLVWAETHCNHIPYWISMYNSKRINDEEQLF